MLAFITAVDIRTHRISNKSILVLGSVLITDINSAAWRYTLTAIPVAFALCTILKIGMGDFKLFSALLITQGSLVLTLDFLQRFFLVTLLGVAISIARRKGLSGSIAFAPFITIPFGLVYLGI
jgi:Flp pilus assembly protein protease CpaA